jgi:hypothetical protein
MKRAAKYHRALRTKLLEKGFRYRGIRMQRVRYIGPLKLIRGMNKGRPNKEDLENARKFARDLVKRFT